MVEKLKALATGTNSRAELNDLYGDAIYDAIRHETNFYNKLPSRKVIGERMGYRVKTADTSTADSYKENDVLVTGNSTRSRGYFGIKQLQVGVEVTGLMMEAAKGAGGIGDVWAEEMKDAALELADELDIQALGAADPNSSDDMSGLKYLIDDGNTYTSYGETISSGRTGYSWAVSNVDSDTEDISLSLMRDMITTNVTDGAKPGNLAFVTTPNQEAKIKDLMQNLQRMVPVSSKVGFEGMVEVDGIPVVTDVNVDSGYLYCVDMAKMDLGISKAPTVIQLPSSKDAQSAAVVTYQQLMNKLPKTSYKKTGLNT